VATDICLNLDERRRVEDELQGIRLDGGKGKEVSGKKKQNRREKLRSLTGKRLHYSRMTHKLKKSTEEKETRKKESVWKRRLPIKQLKKERGV